MTTAPPVAAAPASALPPVNLNALITDNTRKLKNYTLRLPFFTRLIVLILPLIHLLTLLGLPLRKQFNLDPKHVGLDQMHRLNTYPLPHLSLLHLLTNLFALTPLLARFETEIGSLKTILLLAGPLVTFPGALYLALSLTVLSSLPSVQGASALVFTLLAYEATRTAAFKPSYVILGKEVPTKMLPVGWVLLSWLVPGGSVTGHACGLLLGYAFAGRWLRLLEPSEWVLGKVEGVLGKVGLLGLALKLGWVGLGERREGEWVEMVPWGQGEKTAGRRDGGHVLGV